MPNYYHSYIILSNKDINEKFSLDFLKFKADDVENNIQETNLW